MTSYYDEYEDEWRIRAREDWREDPERKEAWRQELEARAEVLAAALGLLEQATALFAQHGYVDSNSGAIYLRCRDAVYCAKGQLERDVSFEQTLGSDCYLGNQAAFATSTDGWPPGRRP